MAIYMYIIFTTLKLNNSSSYVILFNLKYDLTWLFIDNKHISDSWLNGLYHAKVSKDTKNNKQMTTLLQSDIHWTRTELTDDYDNNQQYVQEEKWYFSTGKFIQ